MGQGNYLQKILKVAQLIMVLFIILVPTSLLSACSDKSPDEVVINGIQYKLVNDHYEVNRNRNEDVFDAEIVIADTCEGKPVTKIQDLAFSGYTTLTSITIPDSITEIGNGAFSDCSTLTKIFIGSGVTNIGKNVFNGCKNLTAVHINNLASWCQINFDETSDNVSNPLCYARYLYLNNKLLSDDVVIPDGVTRISNSAFKGCSDITSITIPSSVAHIGFNAFADCKNLTAVYINDLASWCQIDFDYNETVMDNFSNPLYYAKKLYLNNQLLSGNVIIPDKVTQIGYYAFYNCDAVTSVTIPNSVTKINDYAFSNCTKLTNINIPDSVTQIRNYVFSGCHSLTSIDLGKNITKIGAFAFQGCQNITNIVIPDSVTNIGRYAFSNCSNLTNISIGSKVTQIGDYAFWESKNLTTVYINNLANWCKIDFGNEQSNPFHYAQKLYLGDTLFSGNLIIPDGVTQIKYYAFYHCPNITSVTIPASVTRIGLRAFYGCIDLTSATFINPNNWQENRYYTILDLSNTSQNATYLRWTYANETWIHS